MNNKKTELKVYRRLLKYPPFVPWRQGNDPMTIIHHLKRQIRITITAPEPVTVSDAEKLYSSIYCSDNIKDGEETVNFITKISKIHKLTNCNNDGYIVSALERITKLTIKYEDKKKKIIVFHIIDKVEFDPATGILSIRMPKDTYYAFRDRALTINLKNFINLKPGAKNLYGFFISNSGKKFREDLLIERAVITAARKDNVQVILKRSLVELKNNYIIKSFEITKKSGQRYINIGKIEHK